MILKYETIMNKKVLRLKIEFSNECHNERNGYTYEKN